MDLAEVASPRGGESEDAAGILPRGAHQRCGGSRLAYAGAGSRRGGSRARPGACEPSRRGRSILLAVPRGRGGPSGRGSERLRAHRPPGGPWPVGPGRRTGVRDRMSHRGRRHRPGDLVRQRARLRERDDERGRRGPARIGGAVHPRDDRPRSIGAAPPRARERRPQLHGGDEGDAQHGEMQQMLQGPSRAPHGLLLGGSTACPFMRPGPSDEPWRRLPFRFAQPAAFGGGRMAAY